MAFRVQEEDHLEDVMLVLLASSMAKTPLVISISEANSLLSDIKKTATSLPGVTVKIQDEADFIEEMDKYERVRTCSPNLSDAFYRKAAVLGKYIANVKPLIEGRLELLHYLKEQSITYEYHRYGSIFGEEK